MSGTSAPSERTEAARLPVFARASTVFGWLLLGASLLALLWPMLRDASTYGFHDWDAQAAYRYITPLSWKRYGEGPWWHPYLCGGVPAWGYVEGAPNLVSLYLPFYLWLDLRLALRIEVVGDALIGLLGAFLLARSYTRSRTLSVFFAALFMLNGRWALQTAVGHAWHLQYAWLPWVFLAFERARRGASWVPAAWAGVVLAYICYAGGIYPLPHAALFLALHAGSTAISTRSLRPLRLLGLAGVVAIGLAAPKLFAVLDYLSHAPRTIDSSEVIGLRDLFVMLTDTTQRYGSRLVPVPAYNWHEWGIYVGLAGLCSLLLGLFTARGSAGQSYRWLGVACLLLGFGAFHALAPWALLHRVPPFTSQHVPSRFHYVMLFFLGLALLTGVAPWFARGQRRWPWLDWALFLPVAAFCWDLVRTGRVPFEQAFWMRAPSEIRAREPFQHRTYAPVHYVQRDWAAPMLLSMYANSGVVRCYGADPALVIGVQAADRAKYRGMAYVADGPGTAEVVDWTPNRASVRVRGARPGALVVYNMNHDVSWTANGAATESYRGAVAGRVASGDETLAFAYFPRTLLYSLPLFAVTLGLLLAAAGWGRRPSARRSKSAAAP